MAGGAGDRHPDLAAVAAGLRAEWRAEQDAAAADAAAQWRLARTLADWLRDRMHAGDRVAVTIVGRTFVGRVEEVGADLLALRCESGRVELHLCASIPAAFEVVEHATSGGARGGAPRAFRDALLERDARPGVRVGTLEWPDGQYGTLLVSRDFVTIVTRAGVEAIVPLAHVAWVAPTRD